MNIRFVLPRLTFRSIPRAIVDSISMLTSMLMSMSKSAARARRIILFAFLSAVSLSACSQTGDRPMLKMSTNLGDITIELFADDAPVTAQNFIDYVNADHFNGLIFHRVIPGFMIQGGGFDENMQQRATRAPIKNEADNGLKNLRGTLSMARTSDPNSASSQFFINVADNAFLDYTAKTPQGWGYAVFGKVTDGMDIVDQIVQQPTTTSGGHRDVPAKPIVIVDAVMLP
jgi:cyclophilin family peptidyl-prolyl cis-trans isomerase